jgi:hypothetical protein
MPSDLMQLLNFKVPQYQCQKCLALFKSLPLDWKEIYEGKTPLKCPICYVEYVPTNKYKRNQWADYLNNKYHSITFDDPYDHAISLAFIANKLQYYQTN